MRTKNQIILLAASAMLLLSGFISGGNGLPSEERKVPAFDGLAISVPGEVYLVQGPAQRLIVEGTERVLANLITEVKNGQLTIRTPGRWNFRRNDELRVYITMPELKRISLSGSARVYAESPFRTDIFSVSISGSGRVIYTGAPLIDARISGSGRVVNAN